MKYQTIPLILTVKDIRILEQIFKINIFVFTIKENLFEGDGKREVILEQQILKIFIFVILIKSHLF